MYFSFSFSIVVEVLFFLLSPAVRDETFVGSLLLLLSLIRVYVLEETVTWKLLQYR